MAARSIFGSSRAAGARLRSGYLLAAILVAVSLVAVETGASTASGASSSSAAASAPVVTAISTDPYTNVTAQHATEVEPHAVANGNTIVSAVQAGRFNAGGGSTNVGWATSLDGGATWTHGFLPRFTTASTPAGTYNRTADPSVAYDSVHGVWMIAGLGIVGSGTMFHNEALAVSRSVDGTTWSDPIVVSNIGGPDKDWIVCDNGVTSPNRGTCYAVWSNEAQSNLLQASTSADGGLTWSAPVGTSGAFTGYDVQPVVRPDGSVVVVATRGTAIVSYGSNDGGTTWSAPVTLTTIKRHTPAGGVRAFTKPTAQVGSDGTVYAVWADCRFSTSCVRNDLVVSTSTNGTTWSAPGRIPLDEVGGPSDFFLPSLGIDSTTSGSGTHLGLLYYYYPIARCGASPLPACELDVGFVASSDGGANWSAQERLNPTPMSISSLPATTSGRMVGEYFATLYVGGNAVTVFIAAEPVNGGVFSESLYSALVGQPVPTVATNISPPTISGVVRERQVLTASPGVWNGGRPIGYTYQWVRCDQFTSVCENIVGAIAKTYTAAAADVGYMLGVVVTATNVAGSAAAASAHTAVVVAAPPANTARPRITGTAAEGSTLTTTTGTWASSQPVSYSFQWRRCSSTGTACVNIDGATNQTYVLAVADLGARLTVVVMATNSVGSTTATPTSTTAIIVVQAPTMTAPTAVFQTVTTFSVTWSVTGSTVWVGSYDVRQRSAGYGATLPATYEDWQSAVTATSAPFSGTPGTTYCFSARARDLSGNLSAWSADKCTAVPVDDTALVVSGAWSRVAASTVYLGSVSRSITAGDSLSLVGVTARRLSLVATTCSTCGIVNVYSGATLLKQVSLKSTSTKTKQVLAVVVFATVQTGDITIQVNTPGSRIDIDGLAVSAA